VLYLEPEHKNTSLLEALTFANHILKKRSVVFILSDFMDSGYNKPLEILAQKHDVIAIQILDEAELKLPDAGVLNLYDPETGDTLYCNISATFIQKVYEVRVFK